jgi:hypothetical protein
MATTGELQAIIEELHLVDVGDAASYFGEEALVEDESGGLNLQGSLSGASVGLYSNYAVSSCEESSFQ